MGFVVIVGVLSVLASCVAAAAAAAISYFARMSDHLLVGIGSCGCRTPYRFRYSEPLSQNDMMEATSIRANHRFNTTNCVQRQA